MANNEQHPVSQASLEGLPAELRYQILHSCPDVDTLSALVGGAHDLSLCLQSISLTSVWTQVHASPLYHCLYRQDSARIWTSITLRYLRTRELNFLDVLPGCIQVSLHNAVSPATRPSMHTALQACYDRKRKGESMKLKPMLCKTLLNISDAVWWNLSPLDDVANGEVRLISSRSGNELSRLAICSILTTLGRPSRSR